MIMLYMTGYLIFIIGTYHISYCRNVTSSLGPSMSRVPVANGYVA